MEADSSLLPSAALHQTLKSVVSTAPEELRGPKYDPTQMDQIQVPEALTAPGCNFESFLKHFCELPWLNLLSSGVRNEIGHSRAVILMERQEVEKKVEPASAVFLKMAREIFDEASP